MPVPASEVLPQLYTYWMDVTEVHDGDTITVDWDLGRDVIVRDQKIRLYGINAPEVNKPEQKDAGIRARDFLRAIVLNKRIIVKTVRDSKEKYGRYLGTLYAALPDGSYFNVNQAMVENGHAVKFMGDP